MAGGFEEDELSPELAAMKERLADLSPALLGPVVDMAHAMFAGIWLTAGAYVGTPWEPLSEATLRRKIGGSAEILVGETGDLRASLTEEENAYGYEELTDDGMGVKIGTNVPYADFHDLGTRFTPRRQIVPDELPDEDRQRFEDIIEAWVVHGNLNGEDIE